MLNRECKPDVELLNNLLQQKLIVPYHYFSQNPEKAAAFKHAMIELIISVIQDSQLREFPDYIEFALKTPGFQIVMVDSLAEEMAASYLTHLNIIALKIPTNASEWQFLRHFALPHEFWHPYVTTLRAKERDPRPALVGNFATTNALAAAPYSTEEERLEYVAAFEQGMARIAEYKALLAKKQLSAPEQNRLKAYLKATANYQPLTHKLSAPVSPSGKLETVQRVFAGQAHIGKPEFNFYTGQHQYQDLGDTLIFEGQLVDKLDSDRKRGFAFIQDTLFKQYYISQKYVKQAQADQGNLNLTFNTETDANLAANFKKINQVFFPERMAFHQKMRQKYLAPAVAPVKLPVYFKLVDDNTKTADDDLNAEPPVRTPNPAILFAQPSLNWKEACLRHQRSLDDKRYVFDLSSPAP